MPDLPDPWGGTLGEEFVLNFRTESLPPTIIIASGSDVLFLTPRDTVIPVQVTNFYNIPTTVRQHKPARFHRDDQLG